MTEMAFPMPATPAPLGQTEPVNSLDAIDEVVLAALRSGDSRDRMLPRSLCGIIDQFLASDEPQVQLPPHNSFRRRICHKVAEYYDLDHVVLPEKPNCVVLLKTAKSHASDRLANLIATFDAEKAQPVQKKIIMKRRTDSASSSGSAPSATGIDGSGRSGSTLQSAAESQALLDREEQYAQTRARIFSQEVSSPPRHTPLTRATVEQAQPGQAPPSVSFPSQIPTSQLPSTFAQQYPHGMPPQAWNRPPVVPSYAAAPFAVQQQGYQPAPHGAGMPMPPRSFVPPHGMPYPPGPEAMYGMGGFMPQHFPHPPYGDFPPQMHPASMAAASAAADPRFSRPKSRELYDPSK
eukprot:m.97570 g.97570  ORF g.97570 m.97570 type:complete len:349 (-) comp8830_c0_seq2:8467-9513(-)